MKQLFFILCVTPSSPCNFFCAHHSDKIFYQAPGTCNLRWTMVLFILRVDILCWHGFLKHCGYFSVFRASQMKRRLWTLLSFSGRVDDFSFWRYFFCWKTFLIFFRNLSILFTISLCVSPNSSNLFTRQISSSKSRGWWKVLATRLL